MTGQAILRRFPSPDVWEQQEMREALAQREISAVYRNLREEGISQRQIAAMTGQSQSEVSEILKGRQVMAYDVLERIADGLGVPRAYMGLAYDEATEIQVVGAADEQQAEEDESVKRRNFLAHAAQVMTAVDVEISEARQVLAAARALRALDYHYGGGFARDAVNPGLSWWRGFGGVP